ncbi:serine--tRNA ligase [Nanoarchaeota archaeon]
MLDPKFIRDNSKIVRDSTKKRGMDPNLVKVFLETDEEWRKIKGENDNLRSQRNKISQEIKQAKKEGKKIDPILKKAKELPKKIELNEAKRKDLEERRQELLETIPNILDKRVPVGDPTKNKTLKVYKKPTKPKFPPKGHEELLVNLDQLDISRAAKVSGARFYYLKKDLARLNHALINFALELLHKKGFTVMQTPYMIKKEALKGAMNLASFKDDVYKIEDEDLYLIGTAEHAINAYYMDEVIDVSKPIRFAGFSSCFRKESGTHGKDTKGIFRVHQFEKVEQFIFCNPKDSWKEFELLKNNAIEIFKKLGIPFRTVILSSEDMNKIPTITIDLEGWFPTQKAFRELGSCSNCLDYQARRSRIKYLEKNERKLVHTLNNTAIATERMLACIVENYQKKDGSIEIPKALQKYMGIKAIKPTKK